MSGEQQQQPTAGDLAWELMRSLTATMAAARLCLAMMAPAERAAWVAMGDGDRETCDRVLSQAGELA